LENQLQKKRGRQITREGRDPDHPRGENLDGDRDELRLPITQGAKGKQQGMLASDGRGKTAESVPWKKEVTRAKAWGEEKKYAVDSHRSERRLRWALCFRESVKKGGGHLLRRAKKGEKKEGGRLGRRELALRTIIGPKRRKVQDRGSTAYARGPHDRPPRPVRWGRNVIPPRMGGGGGVFFLRGKKKGRPFLERKRKRRTRMIKEQRQPGTKGKGRSERGEGSQVEQAESVRGEMDFCTTKRETIKE